MQSLIQAALWTFVIAAASQLALGQHTQQKNDAQPDAIVTEIYDIRDLATLIPSNGAPPEEALDEFVNRLSGHLDAQVGQIFPGLFHIDATREQHQHLLQSFEHIRKLYSESYEVTVFTYEVSAGESPSIGAAAKLDGAALIQREVIPRRTMSQISAIVQRTYVASLEPVVAEHATAYTPRTKTVDEGLSLSVILGAGADDEKSTALRLSGELTLVSLKRSTGPDSEWRVDLPDVQKRSIKSALRVELGKPTVTAVVAGREAGQATVIAAAVKKVAQ